MNAMRKITVGGDELTPKQALFSQLVAEGHQIGVAAKMAGYDAPASAGTRLQKSAQIQRAIYEHRQAMLTTEGGSLAVRTMFELCQPGMPVTVRFTAAKWLGEAAGHGAVHMAAKSLDNKHPSEMNETELFAHMQELRAVIEAGKAVVSAAPADADPAKLLEGKADPVPVAV